MRREAGERAKRAARRAQTAALDRGLALVGLWLRDVACVLDGVEAFYITHNRAQTQLLCALADEHGLLMTGSADFHGPEHCRFSRFRAFELHGCEPRLGPIGA